MGRRVQVGAGSRPCPSGGVARNLSRGSGQPRAPTRVPWQAGQGQRQHWGPQHWHLSPVPTLSSWACTAQPPACHGVGKGDS